MTIKVIGKEDIKTNTIRLYICAIGISFASVANVTRLLREEANIYWLQLIWITIKHERIQLLFWHWPVSKWICLTRSFRFLRRHTTNISVGTIQRQKIDSLTQPLYTVQQSTPNNGRASVFHTYLPQKQSDTGISCYRVRYVPTTMWREWIHTLTIVLRNAVDAAGMLPAETPAERSGSSSGLLQRKKEEAYG